MMDVAIKDKWLNLEAKCRLCTDIFCCKEHRIAHEDKMHPVELKSFLSAQNNNLNITVSAVKLDKSSIKKTKASKEKIFKTPPTPQSTRKRKRETVSIPENLGNQHLLQSLGKKKKKRSNILPHLRTPKENPKSPLAIINNGVKNEIFIENNVCGSATKSSICMMKTSSPFSEGKENDFISMTPIENRSPEIVSIGSGEIQNNKVNITPDTSYGLELKKEPHESHDNIHNELSEMDVSRNSMETNSSKTESKVPTVENDANILNFAESVRNETEINERTSNDETHEIKPNTSLGEFQKNESFTSSGMSSPSVQDISLPLQLNSSDNFSNGSNQSGNLSGFQMILSPPDAFLDSGHLKIENTSQIITVNEHGKRDSNKTMNDQIKLDETMDEVFMTPVFNNQSNDMSIDEFRTPSEWEHSSSVLQKCDNKTPKCPVVYRAPKVLEHRINNIEEKMSGNLSTAEMPQENIQADEKANQVDESQFENRNETIFIKGSVNLQHISFECMNPKNLASLLQNPGNTFSKRDSGFQSLSETSNMLSGNYSNRMPSDNSNSLEEERIPLEIPDPSGISFNNDSSSPMHSRRNSDDLSCSSLRDCNIGEEFTLELDPGMILHPGLYLNLSNSSTDSSDGFCPNERLKNHPNINYERRKNIDFMFDVQKFGNESDLFSPTKSIKGENDISIEESEQSKAHENIHSKVVDDQSIPNETINYSTAVFAQSIPDESIHNMSTAVFLQSIPEETMNNMSTAVFGQSVSEKTMHNMSTAVFGQSISEETMHNMSTAIFGQSIPEETMHNMSTAVFGQSISDETINNSTTVFDQSISYKTIQNMAVIDKSLSDETIENTVVKDKSVLDGNIHRTGDVSQSVLNENIHSTVVNNLDKIDFAEIEEHIRRRDPIREYTTTLEISRKILKRVEGRGPYYSQLTLSNPPSFITLKKEPEENETSPAKENESSFPVEVESSCCVM